MSGSKTELANEYPQLIGGQLRVQSGTNSQNSLSIPVTNPATEQTFAHAPKASEEDLDEAVFAARRAFGSWSALPYEKRKEYLLRFAAAIEEDAKEIAKILTMEQGKPFTNSLAEISSSVSRVRSNVELGPLVPDILHEDEKSRTEVHHVPLGVVAAITPWNFPVLIAVSKLSSALLTGNTVVVMQFSLASNATENRS